MKLTAYFILAAFLLNSCKTELKKDLCRYAYRSPKSKSDSLNYVLPVSDHTFDTVTLNNSRHILEAFSEPNISLKGSDTPIIRLVVDGVYKLGLTSIRITGNTLIKKKYLSGNCFPEPQPDRLSPLEKRDYYILERNLGVNQRVLSEKVKAFNDSVSKNNPLLFSSHYYDSLVRKATPAIDFTYRADTIILSSLAVNKLFGMLNTPQLLKLPPYDIIDSLSIDEGGYYIEINTPTGYSLLQQSGNSRKRTGVEKLFKYMLELAGIQFRVKN